MRETATYIAAGSSHTCAILSNKTIKCWGDNANEKVNGYIGVESIKLSQKTNPIQIDIGQNSRHTCVILSDKTIKCWGLILKARQAGALKIGATRLLSVGQKEVP